MPALSTPRSRPALIKKGSLASAAPSAGGSCAPTKASGTLMPTRALGAPQTICNRPLAECAPTSTLHTRSRSALGCCTASTISPTTTPENGGAALVSDSTSSPAMVSKWASSAVLRGGLQNSRSQDSGNCMV